MNDFLTLKVNAPSHSYPIVIAQNVITQNISANINKNIIAGNEITPKKQPLLADFASYLTKQVMIVSNDTVAPLYLDYLEQSLKAIERLTLARCILPDGEYYKTQESVNKIYDALMQAGFGRDCTLIALGGGVIGDIVGFAAASFMRGVNFVQIPTTLLAQVDSSVGGKTGINHPLGKNMIGAFWQPCCVFSDMAVLKSLPEREFAAGMAEVIKYGCIMDKAFLSWLIDHKDAINAKDSIILAKMVYRCCQYKADIVACDEKEQGVRAYLNFGHTFAHAIETHMGYGVWLHGEAVAVGMVQATRLSYLHGFIDKQDCEFLLSLLQAFNLPTIPPKIDSQDYLHVMRRDKKVQAGKMRFVLLKALGQAMISDEVSDNYLMQVLTN